MESLIYVWMDVHKEGISLYTYLMSTGEFFGETKMSLSLLTERIGYEKSVLGIYCQATNLSDFPETLFYSLRGRW